MRHSKNFRFRLFAMSLAACVGLIGAVVSIAGLFREAEAQEATPAQQGSVVREERRDATTVTLSTVNTATWTTSNPGPTDVVPAAPRAVVDVGPPSLFLGTGAYGGAAANDAYRTNVLSNTHTPIFSGVPVWGATYDPTEEQVLFTTSTDNPDDTDGSTLMAYSVRSGAVISVGKIMSGSAELRIDGLAFKNGTLYAVHQFISPGGPAGLYEIARPGLAATLVTTLPSGAFSGIDADPVSGLIYGANDSAAELVQIGLDGTLTTIAPYPDPAEGDLDGLAIGGGRAYMIPDDPDPGRTYVYDFGVMTYTAPISAPWDSVDTFSGGAWLLTPGIALTKTVGTEAGICAETDTIFVEAATDVQYCYRVTNTGNVTLTRHDLVDSELGTLLSNFPLAVAPGGSVTVFPPTTTITSTTVNTATWTTFNPGLADVVSATARAVVGVGPHPLFLGTGAFAGAAANDAYRTNVLSNTAAPIFSGVPVWGATYDPAEERVLFTTSTNDAGGNGGASPEEEVPFTTSPDAPSDIDGSTLMAYSVRSGAVISVGKIMSGSAELRIDGLALKNGTLYAVHQFDTSPGGPAGLYEIARPGLAATLVTTLPSGAFSGIAADADSGLIYGVNDSAGELVQIGLDGTLTTVAPYPDPAEGDLDGLAIGGGRAYMIADDPDPGQIYVYDFEVMTYTTPVSAPWDNVDTFSGGAWITSLVTPSIALTKTVGTEPGVCADTSTISVQGTTDVQYCYRIRNTGEVTLTRHDLVDSELDSLLSSFNHILGPGEETTVFATMTTITATTVNTATWTAYNPGPTDVVTATDSATVDLDESMLYLYLPQLRRSD